MTILDVTQSYSAQGGGVRTYLHSKRDVLLRETEHAHVLVVPGAEDTVTREGRATTYTVASPPVPGSPNYRLLLGSRRVLRILEAERPDLIETHDAYNLPWTALLYRRRTPATAVTAVYHTDVARVYVEPFVEKRAGARAARVLGRATDRLLVGGLYPHMDSVVALSEAAAAGLRAVGVERVRVLPLGVDADVFHPSRRDDALRAGFGVGPGEPLLVYVGRLDAEKRPAEVVEAFARLPADLRAHLVVAGDGPDRAALEARAAEVGRVHLTGFLANREALARLLASADLYVSAMPHETFGLSVVEAQACGLPVVGVASGAMPDRVPPDVGRLGPVGDVAAMASNVEAVLRGDAAAMGRRARARVEADYAWPAVIARFLESYADALARRPGRGGSPRAAAR